MDRIVVVGVSGAGKTSLARRIAGAGGHRHIELDSIYHQPGWVPLDEDEYRERVREEICDGRWVVDGNYSVVRDLTWEAADTIVWMDPPRWRVMARVVRRTLVRGLFRVELWNGNRERLSNFVRRDPEENIVLWAWTTYPKLQDRYGPIFATDEWAPRRKVRIRTEAEADALVRSITRR